MTSPNPTAPPRRVRAKRRQLRRFSLVRALFLLLLWGATLGAAGLAFAIRTVNRDLPTDLTALLDYSPSRRSTLMSADGEEIGTFFIENRRILPLARMPAHVPAAFISAEDRRFFRHRGFDPIGILRAARANFRSDDVQQGGSTLTQQIIKQVILTNEEALPEGVLPPALERDLASVKKYTRKFKELILAVRLERELTKAEILTIYLNHIYLGHGAYGVGAAADAYFGKDVENLTVAEAAMLAGLVPSPSVIAPHIDFPKSRERQLNVLARMREDGYLTDAEVAAARAEPLALVDGDALNHLAAPYFVEQVRRLATTRYGNSTLFRGGLKFHGTIDTRAQAVAEAAVRHGLEQLDRRLGFRGPIGRLDGDAQTRFAAGPARPYQVGQPPESLQAARIEPDTVYVALVTQVTRTSVVLDAGPATVNLVEADAKEVLGWRDQGQALAVGDLVPVRIELLQKRATLAQTPNLQGALVAMEAETGRVVAMVGGYDWRQSVFNRATQAKRQIGSAIKPFIYAAAIEAGRTQVDRMTDGPVYVPTATGVWSPSNYDGKFAGPVTLKTALARSLNTISVQLLVQVGLDRVLDILRGFGITSKVPRHVSISLGTPDLTLLEVTAGYAGIAAGGRAITPRFFDVVTDTTGKVVDDLRISPPGPQVLSPEVAYVTTDLLRGVVRTGTAKAATALGRPAAGKTGTSANYRDVWFIGYTRDLVVGVWIGRDDSTPIGDKITGGGVAVPIWLEFMQKAHPATPVRDFAIPPDVVFARADESSGAPAGVSTSAVWVPFVRGTVPPGFLGKPIESFAAQTPAPPTAP